MVSNQGAVVEIVRGGAWYRSSVQPVRNAEGKATMVLFSATDITELKRTQQELVELNRTLDAGSRNGPPRYRTCMTGPRQAIIR